MRDHLLFHVNGRPHRVSGPAAFRSLSDYLRQDLGLTGTKIVCAEGDCGACSVLVGRPGEAAGGPLRYVSVDACIYPLHQCDGAHVVTVEGLSDGTELHPVQEAMVACHGSQCGFCTPGFVVALAGLYENRPKVDEAAVRHACTGNLCRCTGYVQIIESALAVDASKVRRLADRYETPEMRAELSAAGASAVSLTAEGRTFFKPASLSEAVAFKAARPEAVIVAGGTETGVWANKRAVHPPVVMSLLGVPGLSAITREGDTVAMGANTTWTAVEEFFAPLLPEFGEICRRFGSPQIRNVGTLVGNIANGSPIADSLPLLMVTGAELEIAGPKGARRAKLDGFYTGYKKKALAADEIIARVLLPLPRPDETLKLYKVSRRTDMDISTFGAAVLVRRSGSLITHAAIAYNGVGATVARLPKTEAALVGRPFAEDTFAAAGRTARAEISPITDVRGGRDFRLQLAENILRRFFAECSGSGEPSAASEAAG
jgi:xanthine dehydrogenase small subunit